MSFTRSSERGPERSTSTTSYHPTCQGHCPLLCFSYFPSSSLSRYLSLLLTPGPPTCLPPCTPVQWSAPSVGEKLLTIIGSCQHQRFSSSLSHLPPSPAQLPTSTQKTHTHTHRPKPSLTPSFLPTSACRRGWAA